MASRTQDIAYIMMAIEDAYLKATQTQQWEHKLSHCSLKERTTIEEVIWRRGLTEDRVASIVHAAYLHKEIEHPGITRSVLKALKKRDVPGRRLLS